MKLNPGLPRQHSTRRLFHPQTGLKFKEETSDMLHFEYSFLWSRSLDTSESRSEIPRKFWNVVLKKDGEDHLDLSCKKWRNITYSQGRNILHTVKQRKAKWIGHIMCRNCFLRHVIEGKTDGTEKWQRSRKQLLDDMEMRKYWTLKEEALDRTVWRTRFGSGCEPVVRQTTWRRRQWWWLWWRR
jgi:hypothetical protein